MKKAINIFVLICFVSGISFLNGCKKKPDPPTLTTTAVSEVTTKTAISGGNVTSDGGAAVTARGVCWSTTAKPTITDSKTTDGAGTGAFTSNITGLTANTLYYVRAYATNSEGTSYGNEVSFTTEEVVAATLTTAAVTEIASTTATSGGEITADGGGDITARGVCWSTTANPTTADRKTENGNGTGAFTSSLDGLLPGTTYHVRAYATNASGTAYGAEVTFTTLSVVPVLTTADASSVTSTTATSGGNITSDGGATITARGVCWGTSTGPVATGPNRTTDGTGTGSFTSSITGLAPNTTYYVRAYATNSQGTAYGNEITFTTPAAIPTVTTTAASAITQTSATSGGNVTATGGAPVTARGVCWSTSTNPTVQPGSSTSNGSGTGSFTSNITGLTPGTRYYVRAYATNSVGTAYGNEVTFTTSASTPPTVTTASVTSITAISAVSGGNVTADGGGTVTARGVCWGTSPNPTEAGSHTTDGTGRGNFTSNITGLTPGTKYFVRAYATNSAGTSYGEQQIFITRLADEDGNTYNVVEIGTQLWMAENLKTTKFNDGTLISNVEDNTSWMNQTAPAYCWFGNDAGNKAIYGGLYNWYAIGTGKLCPAGWHVPTDNEFKTLEIYLGMTQAQADGAGFRGNDEGNKLKSTDRWAAGGAATNSSGFTALPGGYRAYFDGQFAGLQVYGSFGTSTEWSGGTGYMYRQLKNDESRVLRMNAGKSAGFSVRCVHD